MSWVYVRSESGLWTVGHYDPAGGWHPDSDHGSDQAAGDRCAYLNGGNGKLADRLEKLEAKVQALDEQFAELDARTPYPDGSTR